jgi:hypothetical protein
LELEARLQSAEKTSGRPGQLPSSIQQMLDSALAANNAKLQSMKKTHYRLLEQYTELQMKYHELEGERQAELGRMAIRGRADSNDHRNDPSSGRRMSNRHSAAFGYGGSSYPSTLVGDLPQEDYDMYSELLSPTSPSRQAFLPHPARYESLSSPKSPANLNYSPHDYSAPYEPPLTAHFQTPPLPPETVASSGKSAYSVDTNSSKEARKDKVAPKSEVRYYGRGKQS